MIKSIKLDVTETPLLKLHNFCMEYDLSIEEEGGSYYIPLIEIEEV